MSCGLPESPGNGSFVGSEFTLDSTVVYQCNEGFQLAAGQPTTTVCQEDGLWSNLGRPPACQRECPVSGAMPAGGKGPATTFPGAGLIPYRPCPRAELCPLQPTLSPQALSAPGRGQPTSPDPGSTDPGDM